MPHVFSTLFFDLDDTLYPASSGLWQGIRARIDLFMQEKLGIAPADIPALREAYFKQYGTTLRGLEANFDLDHHDYLAYVHDVPLRDYIGPDPVLRAALDGLPHRKFIFTNADAAHARRVMEVLGVGDCFDGIIDVNAIAPYCKPMPETFKIAMKLSGETDPARCAMFDDQVRITRAARAQGLFAVLVGNNFVGDEANASLTNWESLSDVLNGRK